MQELAHDTETFLRERGLTDEQLLHVFVYGTLRVARRMLAEWCLPPGMPLAAVLDYCQDLRHLGEEQVASTPVAQSDMLLPERIYALAHGLRAEIQRDLLPTEATESQRRSFRIFWDVTRDLGPLYQPAGPECERAPALA